MKVEYIDHMGDDNSIVNAARVSFHKQADQFSDEQNHKLIRYLAEHKHEIPFAHTAITLRMKAPIAIRTQCFKHKVGFVENEVSRRYVKSEPELFVPTFRHAPNGSIKQGSGDMLVPKQNHYLQGRYQDICNEAIREYELLLSQGVAPEQARFVLPQGVMTEWIWTGSLLAFVRFYNLRTNSHAQKEIQELAKMVGDIIKPLYPVSWTALTDFSTNT